MKLKTPLQLYLWLINMVVKTHLAIWLCSLESVCGEACVYRHIARCVFTTIFISDGDDARNNLKGKEKYM